MRVKGGTKSKNRRKRLLKVTSGHRGRAKNCLKIASEHADRAMEFSYRHRKLLKRDMRALWITRLTAACREMGFSYSSLMNACKKKSIGLNRKMLADLAATEPKAFKAVTQSAGL